MRPFLVSAECAFVTRQLGKGVCNEYHFLFMFPSFNILTSYVVLKDCVYQLVNKYI